MGELLRGKMLLTVFLGIVILALLIGNGLLFLVPKKTSLQKQATEQNENTVLWPQSQSFASNEQSAANPAIEKIVLEERLNIMHNRLLQIENIILTLKKKGFFENLNGENSQTTVSQTAALEKKIFALEEFKKNSRIEIEALKQRLNNLRNELALDPDNVKKKQEIGIPEEKIHALVFNKR